MKRYRYAKMLRSRYWVGDQTILWLARPNSTKQPTIEAHITQQSPRRWWEERGGEQVIEILWRTRNEERRRIRSKRWQMSIRSDPHTRWSESNHASDQCWELGRRLTKNPYFLGEYKWIRRVTSWHCNSFWNTGRVKKFFRCSVSSGPVS